MEGPFKTIFSKWSTKGALLADVGHRPSLSFCEDLKPFSFGIIKKPTK